jgi:lipopolysaccharide/colanic/teichoic acid biosynthesis glycosyltransferase
VALAEILRTEHEAGPSAVVIGRRGTKLAKRVVDVAVGVPLCLAFAVPIALFALVLAVQLRGTPLFIHRRIGRGGRLIAIPKLRTLPTTTPRYADKTAVDLEPVSRFAALLRRTHLDELPQLFLVPLGHLSLVGPRPRMLSEAMACGDEYFATIRTSVAQGCTGLWQISHAQRARVSDGPEFDHFYVENHSLRLDVWIMWRTLLMFVGGRPVGLDDVPRWALRSTTL